MTDAPGEIKLITDTDVFVLRGRPCELSAFSFIPPSRKNIPRERNFFNSTRKEHDSISRYDRQFTGMSEYNKNIHRDDRQHAKLLGLSVHDEEAEKRIPTLSSSVYGHWLHLHADHPDRKHVHVGHGRSEFYRRNGVEFSSQLQL